MLSMGETDRSGRGGQIDLRGRRARGLPFLKPLYGPPPYQYVDDVVLIVVYESAEEAVRECLPRELEPLPGNSVAMCFFLCPEVSGMGPHNFAMPCIPVRHGEYVGQFVPYLYTSTDASLACYREAQGWPAVLGQTEVAQAGGRVRARVTRDGREVMRATATVGGDPITSLDFPPIILYKEIPSIDGAGRDVARFITSTSRFTRVDFRAGSGEVSFPDPGDDPIARLRPLRYTTALFGTMDDLYPETIRVFEDLG
jgi:acetoacetate decarboxylase